MNGKQRKCVRSRRVPAHASICYKSRGLAAAPGPAAQGGETRATQGDGYEVVALGERLRGISLGSSGDPIIHMWIMDGCVCVYTARVVSLCVMGGCFSLSCFSFFFLFLLFRFAVCSSSMVHRRGQSGAGMAH